MNKAILISLILLLSTVSSYKLWGIPPKFSNMHTKVNGFNPNYNQTQYWFNEQLLDHFDLLNPATWSQRYWVVDDYYNPGVGPVFLYICGEYTCAGLTDFRLFPLELLEEQQGLMLVLEHRFYGLSQPFNQSDLTLDVLSYLNVDQALADLAYFLNWAKTYEPFNITANTQFVNIGGSYPGALSAWFRSKYPYLTVGALASSAVINSIVDFWEFDYQVYLSSLKSGPNCPASIQNLSNYVENQLYGPNNSTTSNQTKSIFGATLLSNDEFLWFWSDTIAEMVQYGSRTYLCDLLASQNDTEGQFNALIPWFLANASASDYGSYYLSNTTFDPNNDGSRQWIYQVCSEVGWFNTANPNQTISMRSQRLNLTFYQQWCLDSYGQALWPNSTITNLAHGGLGIEATNLIMTNGCEDPWQWASLEVSKPGITTIVTECDDCGHCAELYTPTPTDPLGLAYTRLMVQSYFNQWLSQGQQEKKEKIKFE